MKVQHIEILVAIAQAGSLRGAAEKLGKSQPALTKSLKHAEEELGVSLFHRSSRGVKLTRLGERVISRARTITNEIRRLDEEVSQLRGELNGTVSVCLSPFAAIQIMPRALALFQKSYPDIQVALSSGLFPNALKSLKEGVTDIVIGPAPPASMTREINVEPLLETPIAVITSPDSSYANARSLTELVDAQWIMIGAPNGPGDIFRQPFIENGLVPPFASTTSESYFGALALVESLGVVCTFPELLFDHSFQHWSLKKINLREKIKPIQIALMTRTDHPLTPASYALVNCIRRRATMIKLKQ